METQTTSKLLQLPPEVLLHTLAYTTPRDCARVATLSRLLNALCSTWTLHRDLLVQLADCPTLSLGAPDFPYQTICRHVVQATAALDRIDHGLDPPSDAELVPILETLVYLATTRPPANVASSNEAVLEKYLSPKSGRIVSLHPRFSNLGRNPRLRSAAAASSAKGPDDVVVSELVSRLHVLSTPSLVALASPEVRTAAREIVYERLNFTRTCGYGPLKADGSGLVDYRKLEAISIVMASNLDEAGTMGWGQETGTDDDDATTVPTGWSSTRTGSATVEGGGGNEATTDPRDWAGVTTHEWRGTYAFLHYPVYHSFNHHRTSSYVPSLADESEAVGDCMSLKLELLPEGQELLPPMDAFASSRPSTHRNGLRTGRGASDDDDDDDSDFDDQEDDDLHGDDTSSGSSSSSDEGDINTHFVTNRSQPRRQSPPTSSPDELTPTVPLAPLLGPLPPPSTSKGSERSSFPTRNPSRPSSSEFPKLSFHGTSMPLQLRTLAFTGTFVNAQSHFNIRDRSIRGTVEMNPEGEIIWKYIIRYGGVDHWAMTGVQVGGPKSKFGVLGSWSCADREAADEEGPNGPFWYWPNMAVA